MLALIKWGLWQKRWFIFWWCIAIFALIFINLIFYPSFKDQAAEIEKTFAQLPESATAFISDTGEFFSPEGYLSSQVFYLMLPMLLIILSISLGSSLIGREEREGTIELLLSRPVSRTKLLASKAFTGLIILTIASLVGILTSTIMSRLVELEVPTKHIFVAGLASFTIALGIGAIAFMFASFGKARSASIGIATIFALGGYILASLVDIASWLRFPSYLMPFYYYRPGAILQGNYELINFLIIGSVAVVAGTISWISFRKRDIVG